MTCDKNIAGHASGLSRYPSPATRHGHVAALLLALACCLPAPASEATNSPPPTTARDFYNAGATLLNNRKFDDAERLFQSALATQDDGIQPKTLYNLGQVRFAQGLEMLKKGPDAQKVTAQGNQALAAGEQALAHGESALADNELSRMIAAYVQGRGARRELREAEKAVQAAMEAYGKTLTRWQRAADDFKGAAELNPADTNAMHNAEIMQQYIAALVDSLRQMQAMDGKMDGMKNQLGKMLSKLKGQIPAPNAPPGPDGDDDEGEDNGRKPDSLTGQKEGATREGDQMQVPLSPDQAGQILDGMSLDGSRRLPMSDKPGAKPKEKTGRNW